MTAITLRAIENDLARRHMYVAVHSEVELTKRGYVYTWIAVIVKAGAEVIRTRAESKGAAIQNAYEHLPKE